MPAERFPIPPISLDPALGVPRVLVAVKRTHPKDDVLFGLCAANHDERAFACPERFDVGRQPNAHLTFGCGPRFCIGAPLARIKLEAVFCRLIPRFPTLRLVVPIEQLRACKELLTGGLAALPVTW